MASMLVVFESKYGQASKIAEHVGEMSRRYGLDARVVEVDVARSVDLRAFDAIAVVAPVYFQHHPRRITAFVKTRADILSKVRSGLFSVSNGATASDPAVREEAMRVARALVTATPWHPDVIATVGGAFAYPRYNFVLRYVMKKIAEQRGAPTDTRRTHELTDWAALDRDIALLLRPFLAREAAEFGGTAPIAAGAHA